MSSSYEVIQERDMKTFVLSRLENFPRSTVVDE